MKRILGSILILLLSVSGCDKPTPTQEYRILRTLPHDSSAFTQGLVFQNGVLFESTGRHGTSSIRRVNLESGKVLSIRKLSEKYFGEGLALVGAELIQLTWQSGLAFVYDSESLRLKRTFEYVGEGWGLCFDGESLFMSDGSDTLLKRNPLTFEIIAKIPVTKDGISVRQLNELECVGDEIWANIYRTNRIVRIDKHSGKVKAEIDGYRLSLISRKTSNLETVFNGIAYDPASGHFFVTGKFWPYLFEIEILQR